MLRLSELVFLAAAVLAVNGRVPAHEYGGDELEIPKPIPNIPAHIPGLELSVDGPPKWTWAGEFGPNYWGKQWPTCAQRSQSPINIQHDVARLAFVRPIRFKGVSHPLNGVRLLNLFRFGFLDFTQVFPRVTAEGGPLPAHSRYYLVGADLRVGSNDSRGSEASLNGNRGAFEITLLFASNEHATLKTLHKSGYTVAISFIGKVCGHAHQVVSKDHPGWTPVINGLKKIAKGGSQTSINLPSFRSILPRKPWTGNYYSYVGSLSFPPCSESTIRILYERNICISKSQLAALRGLKSETGANIVDNFREQRPAVHVQIFRSHLDRLPQVSDHRPVFLPLPNIITTTAKAYGYKKKKRMTTTTPLPKPNLAVEEDIYAPYKKATTTTRRTTTAPPNIVVHSEYDDYQPKRKPTTTKRPTTTKPANIAHVEEYGTGGA